MGKCLKGKQIGVEEGKNHGENTSLPLNLQKEKKTEKPQQQTTSAYTIITVVTSLKSTQLIQDVFCGNCSPTENVSDKHLNLTELK